MNLHELTIKSFHEGLLNKKFSALEVTQALFERIKKEDGKIGAYLSTDETGALQQAEAADLAIARGEEIGALAGIPFAVKDNILIEGQQATAGSKVLEGYIASYDAGVIQKLKSEKAVFLGKTNMDDAAMGSSTENSAYQITKNPHDPTRVPGGSSGGSAAAVAADFALAALGSDTGGSIRQPAAFCGVVGFKPTYGAISRSGLIAMTSSLDQIGPLTKTVEDAGIIFNAIKGKDRLDATSSDQKYDDKEILEPNLEKIKKMTVGIPEEYFIDGLDDEIKTAVESARKALESAGVTFKAISLPHTKYAVSTYYIIVPAEVSSNLARLDGIRYSRSDKLEIKNLRDIYFKQRARFGREVKRRIILGTFVLSSGYYDAYYKKAQQVRRLVKQDFDQAFKEVDVILAPTTPTPPFTIGEKINDPLSMYLEDIFTIPVNLAGLPGISIPVRGRKGKLPLGFQLIGKPWQEADILGLGQLYEKETKG